MQIIKHNTTQNVLFLLNRSFELLNGITAALISFLHSLLMSALTEKLYCQTWRPLSEYWNRFRKIAFRMVVTCTGSGQPLANNLQKWRVDLKSQFSAILTYLPSSTWKEALWICMACSTCWRVNWAFKLFSFFIVLWVKMRRPGTIALTCYKTTIKPQR